MVRKKYYGLLCFASKYCNTNFCHAFYSNELKEGIANTLIVISSFSDDDKWKFKVHQTVDDIFSKINQKKEWENISKYLCGLCEASPEVVVKYIQDGIKNKNGIIELFDDHNDDYQFGETHFNEYVVSTLEMLLQLNDFYMDSLEALWQLNDMTYGKKVNETISRVLRTVLMP